MSFCLSVKDLTHFPVAISHMCELWLGPFVSGVTVEQIKSLL